MGCCCSLLRTEDGANQPLLHHNEREAIANLLSYLENRENVDFFAEDPLKALSTLVYSNNLDLQRSAALAFAEITEKEIKAVGREVFKPILFLLNSADSEVQRAACAALGNLAVNNENKILIVEMGGLQPLIKQMDSLNTEVQCNAVGCITNLATQDDNKAKIAKSGALVPLTRLAKNKDLRVQRNATGALLNMTHSLENRQELVTAGAVPVLVTLLSSSDPDVQYYCTTALSNIAVDEINRKRLIQTEPKLVTHLVALMDSSIPRIRCQATLALRNLASDPSYQLEIVRSGGLVHLVQLLKSSQEALILAAVACIRNISIHPLNEGLIVEAGFLEPLVNLLDYKKNEEIRCHAVSTLRNLAASSEKNRLALLEANAVQKCRDMVLQTKGAVQCEISACFAILALADDLKKELLELKLVDVLIPLSFSANSEVGGNAAAALANLCSRTPDISYIINAWNEPNDGIAGFLIRYLNMNNTTFEHIALWTILQLLEGKDPTILQYIQENKDIINGVKKLNLTKNPQADEDAGEGAGAQDGPKLEVYKLTAQILSYLDSVKN